MGAIDEELTFFLNSQIHNESIKIAESVRPVLWSVTTCEASHGQQTKDRRSLSSKYVVPWLVPRPSFPLITVGLTHTVSFPRQHFHSTQHPSLTQTKSRPQIIRTLMCNMGKVNTICSVVSQKRLLNVSLGVSRVWDESQSLHGHKTDQHQKINLYPWTRGFILCKPSS